MKKKKRFKEGCIECGRIGFLYSNEPLKSVSESELDYYCKECFKKKFKEDPDTWSFNSFTDEEEENVKKPKRPKK